MISRWAVGISVGAGVVFTVFAYVTTQVKTVRAGSPWQDDPWDGVVSFTEFLVPALVLVIAVRAVLWLRRGPQPVDRSDQLLRAGVVSTVLIAGTVVTDVLAVVVRADRPLWNGSTPWLVLALLPLGVVAAVAFAAQWRAFRELPARDGRPPELDWLDDLAELVPEPLRRVVTGAVIGFVRRHIVACALVLSLFAGLAVTTADAVGEGWTSPLLFGTGTAIGCGGFFAFCMLANRALRIAVPRAPASPLVRAAGGAAFAGALALPVSAVFRDGIWSALGLPGQLDTPGKFAALIGAAAALAAAAVFGTLLAVRRQT